MNNPPAFPKAGLDPWGKSMPINEGMTLRDYFAAKAMQAYCSDPSWREDMDTSATARAAYRAADAMMNAREV